MFPERRIRCFHRYTDIWWYLLISYIRCLCTQAMVSLCFTGFATAAARAIRWSPPYRIWDSGRTEAQHGNGKRIDWHQNLSVERCRSSGRTKINGWFWGKTYSGNCGNNSFDVLLSPNDWGFLDFFPLSNSGDTFDPRFVSLKLALVCNWYWDYFIHGDPHVES